jgi:hypothetical protein
LALSDLSFTLDELNELMATSYSAAMLAEGLKPANLAAGGGLMPIFRAHAMLALQLQAQIAYLAQIARLSTIPENSDGSPNGDLDSYVEGFGVPRIGATSASSTTEKATLPSVSNVPVTIAVGTVLQRSDGVQYVVTADSTQPSFGFDASGNGVYTIPAGQLSCFLTVTCTQSGAIGNTSKGTISTLVTGPGNPTPSATVAFTNTVAISNGNAAETDTALKARFVLQWSEGRVATNNAVAAAIESVGANLVYSLSDLIDETGAATKATITAIVGFANSVGTVVPPALVAQIAAAITAVRALGIRFRVVPASTLAVTVAGTIVLQPGLDNSPAMITAVTNNVNAYLSSIGLDPAGGSTTASLARVYAAILSTPGVANATNVMLNGQVGDVTAPFGSQITPGTLAITASS